MSSSPGRKGLLFLTLFATPFILVGLFLLGVTVRGWIVGEPWSTNLLTGSAGMVFTLAGAALTAAGIAGARRVNAEAALKARHPGQPWMWNPSWTNRRISDGSRVSSVSLWVFAVIWNGVSAPLAFVLPAEVEKGNNAAWIGLLFPLVGLGLVIAAIRATLRRLRFRESFFVLDTLPAPLGGVLRGRVEVPVERTTLSAASSITATLSCIRRTVTGSGKSRSTSESALWQEIVDVPPASLGMMPGVSTLPIAIPLPSDVPQTDDSNPNDAIIWRLGIESNMPGIDYSATFDVPVFATGKSSEERLTTARATTPPPARTVRERETAEGLVLDFPPLRMNSAAAGIFVFAVIFGGSAFFTGVAGAPFVFPGCFGIFALLLFYFAIDLLLGSAEIVVSRNGIRATRRLLFTRTREYSAALIRDVRMKIGMQQTRVGGTPTAWYQLELVHLNGKASAIGRAIRDKREGEWIVERIRTFLHQSPGTE